MRELSHRNNFKVLMDKTVVLAPADETGSLLPFHFYVPCKCKTVYSANNGDSSDIEYGAVYVVAITDMDSTVAEEVQWQCQARLRFVDP